MIAAILVVSLLTQAPDAGTRGELAKSEVMAVIKRGNAEIRGCYDAALRVPGACDSLDSKVTASWTIERDGTVTHVNVVNNSKDTTLATCVRDVVSRWKFPKPQGGTVDVTYPWIPRIACDE